MTTQPGRAAIREFLVLAGRRFWAVLVEAARFGRFDGAPCRTDSYPNLFGAVPALLFVGGPSRVRA
jgi:hypothetical protein